MTATAAPAYRGNPANIDPEEAFVVSLSSCHMLTFLAIACRQKFVVDSCEDAAVGHMEKNAAGKLAITRVELRPKIVWGGDRKPQRGRARQDASRRARGLFHCQFGQDRGDGSEGTAARRGFGHAELRRYLRILRCAILRRCCRIARRMEGEKR
jgi:hypothetical protein